MITHVPAKHIIKLTGIKKETFFQRVILRSISYVEPFRKGRLYSIADWNEKSPDYKLVVDKRYE